MTTPKNSPVDYQALSAELDALMTELQRDDLDVDIALDHYERGLKIIEQLENYLRKAENRVTKLKSSFSEK